MFLLEHPSICTASAKGKFNADNAIRSLQFWSSIQIVGAPDQVAGGVTWLYTYMQMWLLGCCNCGIYRRNTNVTKMRQKLLCLEAKVSSHRKAMNRCCIKLSWRDVFFVVRMFSSMPGCFPVFQDVCFPFGMFSSLSGCILPCQDVFFPVRKYFFRRIVLFTFQMFSSLLLFCQNLFLLVRMYSASYWPYWMVWFSVFSGYKDL